MAKIKITLLTAVVVLLCGCRALGFDHGPCFLCKQEAFKKEIAKDPHEYPYLQGYMYPPVP